MDPEVLRHLRNLNRVENFEQKLEEILSDFFPQAIPREDLVDHIEENFFLTLVIATSLLHPHRTSIEFIHNPLDLSSIVDPFVYQVPDVLSHDHDLSCIPLVGLVK